MRLRPAVLALLLVAGWPIGQAAGSGPAQGGSTPPPAATLADLLVVRSAAEGWVWAMRTWAPPAAPRDFAGGRFQALLGVRAWGIAVRAEASGLPGNFDTSKPATFHTVAAYVAVHRNVLALPGGIQFGPAAAGGAALPLVGDQAVPRFYHAGTVGLGFRAAAPGWWVYAGFGMNQALRGAAGTVEYQVRMTDRTSAVGTVAVGRGTYYSQIGVAVRWY